MQQQQQQQWAGGGDADQVCAYAGMSMSSKEVNSR